MHRHTPGGAQASGPLPFNLTSALSSEPPLSSYFIINRRAKVASKSCNFARIMVLQGKFTIVTKKRYNFTKVRILWQKVDCYNFVNIWDYYDTKLWFDVKKVWILQNLRIYEKKKVLHQSCNIAKFFNQICEFVKSKSYFKKVCQTQWFATKMSNSTNHHLTKSWEFLSKSHNYGLLHSLEVTAAGPEAQSY